MDRWFPHYLYSLVLLRPIELGAVYDKTKKDNDVIDLPRAVYDKNEIELS